MNDLDHSIAIRLCKIWENFISTVKLQLMFVDSYFERKYYLSSIEFKVNIMAVISNTEDREYLI